MIISGSKATAIDWEPDSQMAEIAQNIRRCFLPTCSVFRWIVDLVFRGVQ